MTVELNPASWPPLCSCYFFPWFLSVAAVVAVQRLFPNCSADVVCVLHSLHLYFPQPRAGFCCGYWVPCLSRPKISSVCVLLFSYKCTKFLSPLVLLCDLLLIFLLYCYYAHSNVCKYMASLNTNVSVLLFCMCLLSQVLVFDPVRVGRV